MGKNKEEEKFWFSTGCDLLDLNVGGGIGLGFQAGDIVNIVGDTGTAKSFLCAEIIANAYHKYKKNLVWRYDNSEGGFKFNTKELYGFDVIPNDDFEESETVQDLYCNYRYFLENLKKDKFGIYVADSLDAMSSDEELNRGDERFSAFKKGKDYDKGSYQMESPRFLSKSFFRELKSLTIEKNALLILVSQVRMNVDPFSHRKYARSGGKALDHWADTILWLMNPIKLKRKDRAIGLYIKGETTKNRTPRPFRNSYFTLYFDYGVDNIGSDLDYLFDLRGKDGKLKNAAEEIAWGDFKKPSVAELKEFILGEVEKEKYLMETVGDEFKKSRMFDYIEKHEDLKKKFEERFGQTKTRSQLIDEAENSAEMRKELTRRVIEKWEQTEAEIKIERKKKYV